MSKNIEGGAMSKNIEGGIIVMAILAAIGWFIFRQQKVKAAATEVIAGTISQDKVEQVVTQSPATQEAIAHQVVEQFQNAAAKGEVVDRNGIPYAPISEEMLQHYRSVGANKVSSMTKAEALEATRNQFRIAAKQTAPGIRTSMMAIAEGMFEQAKSLP